MARIANYERNSNETRIKLSLNIDGKGEARLATGIGFFDHMLHHICKHGFFDMDLQVEGDLDVDCHHTVEDVGIALGAAVKSALGDRAGIRRYGSSALPMDETLALVAMDISGRPYLNFDAEFTTPSIGDLDTEMVEEFFRAFAVHCGMNLHIKLLDGKNNHHIAEGIFKAFGRALDEASSIDPRIEGTLSTKGMLD